MLSPETLESYRRMTPQERLRLTIDLSRSAWRALNQGSPELVTRRYMRLEHENNHRNLMISEGLRRSENRTDLD